MKPWERLLHVAIFLAWFGAALVYGLEIAAIGSEENRLSHQRGADLTTRQDIARERVGLRTDMDWASRRELIEAELRRLRLPLRSASDPGPAEASLAAAGGPAPEGRP